MRQWIPSRASTRQSPVALAPRAPSVIVVPDVLPCLPALGHGTLVTNHSGAFHNLKKPEGTVPFYKEEIFINKLFCMTCPPSQKPPPAFGLNTSDSGHDTSCPTRRPPERCPWPCGSRDPRPSRQPPGVGSEGSPAGRGVRAAHAEPFSV